MLSLYLGYGLQVMSIALLLTRRHLHISLQAVADQHLGKVACEPLLDYFAIALGIDPVKGLPMVGGDPEPMRLVPELAGSYSPIGFIYREGP